MPDFLLGSEPADAVEGLASGHQADATNRREVHEWIVDLKEMRHASGKQHAAVPDVPVLTDDARADRADG